MNFAELYNTNRLAVFNALRSMWAYGGKGESQKAYLEQMETLLGDLFAPSNAVPLVQCMNFYKSVPDKDKKKATDLVHPLWTAPFTPFEHQYESWKTLLDGFVTDKDGIERPKSMCVTTGTGSGKTECFMMPLIKDLMNDCKTEQYSSLGVKAIFLYPLNALMDDQQERLEELIKASGCDIRYAVYNGNLPDEEPDDDDDSDHAKKVRRQIETIRGIDKNGAVKFPHALWTRKQVRENPPAILLTNPTMLEFILLRDADKEIIATADLRWFVIDETHTYTGAAAAELAMTLRRVVLAFDRDPRDIRFATSSATFGNFGEAKDEEELKRLQDKADDALRNFISDITGTAMEQIDIINGERRGIATYPNNADKLYWEKICRADYCSLNDIFPEASSIEEALRLLDDLCDREEARYKAADEKIPAMKAKVHYFYRVPNKGIYADISRIDGEAFHLESKVGIDSAGTIPLLEVGRCSKCGEFIAIGMTQMSANPGEHVVSRLKYDDKDIFDPESIDNGASGGRHVMFFATSPHASVMGDNNRAYVVRNGHLAVALPGEIKEGTWHIVGNDKHTCPHCNEKLIRKTDEQADEIEPDDDRLRKFHVSAEFISRIIAPSVLDQLQSADKIKIAQKREVPVDELVMLHDGQQYISFVDSRQGAARGSLAQNMEQERRWVYTSIYEELRKRANAGLEEKSRKEELLKTLKPKSREYIKLEYEINMLDFDLASGSSYLSWNEVFDLLHDDSRARTFANVFAKHTSISTEIDDDGEVTDDTLRRYVYSVMVEHLSYRPAVDASPETMGLFHMVYPALDRVLQIPPAVERFNELISNSTQHITLDDWKSLLNVYLDFTVRNNQSLYLDMQEIPEIDIEATNRYSSKKPSRKPFNPPVMKQDELARNRVALYLTDMLMKEKGLSFAETQKKYFREIVDVVVAMAEDMVKNEYGILKPSTKYDPSKSKKNQVADDNGFRLNLADTAFALYDNVAVCDVREGTGEKHLEVYRPVGVTFKNYSPYTRGYRCFEIPTDRREEWKSLPIKDEGYSLSEIKEWASSCRKLLWSFGIWGESGVFADRLNKIHTDFPLFIQAEHTAQVAKGIAKKIQRDFKDHLINVLACSTTMEMGVDLGDLEMVMLASVPQMPANYKQRAGRSGRNQKVKSACITLCGSDAIGLRTLFNPLANIIQRAVAMPTVDLHSPQLIQRHVNAFLVRGFDVFGKGGKQGKLSTKVLDYYTRFEIGKTGKQRIVTYEDGKPAHIEMGDEGINFSMFNEKCSSPIEVSKLSVDLRKLLKGTVYSEKTSMQVALAAKDANERCYDALRDRVEELRDAFDHTENDKFRNLLRTKFRICMMQRLLEYWASQRFIPNANMPVNVIDLDLVNSNSDYYSPGGEENPTYTMSQALTQYAPGRKVAIDGVAHTIGGVLSTNTLKQENAYMTIYRNPSRTSIDSTTGLSNIKKWTVNNKEGLTLIQPLSFLPDLETDTTRQIDDAVYGQVESRLIGTQNWDDESHEPHLFQVRTNIIGDGSILYYIQGEGYGYCHCMRCGRTVAEHGVAKEDTPYPDNFNFKVTDKNGNVRLRHKALSGKSYGNYCECPRSAVKRNVIIGDTMPTDFAEIRVRLKNDHKWLYRPEDWTLTLAIVLTNALAEYHGVNRGALGFSNMHNGHIVIFDTNPGGAGYSLKLYDIPTFIEVLKIAKGHIETAIQNNAIDMLLDKFTIKYMSEMRPQETLDWINSELKAKDVLPSEVKAVYPDAVMTSWSELHKVIKNAHGDIDLYVSPYYASSQNDAVIKNEVPDFAYWNYDEDDYSWSSAFREFFLPVSGNVTMNVLTGAGDTIPFGILSVLKRLQGWVKDVKSVDKRSSLGKLRPIAYVNGYLYLTNDQLLSQLNNQWGSGTLYCIKSDNNPFFSSAIDFSEKPNTKIFVLGNQTRTNIESTDLAEMIRNNSNGIVDRFIAVAKANEAPLEIEYQDKYLRTPLGILATLQVMDFFIDQIGKDFKLRFKTEEFHEDSRRPSLEISLGSSLERDQFLIDHIKNLIYQKSAEYTISGSFDEQISYGRKILPHWREMTLKCGDAVLRIMPDGGFINGWRLDGKPWQWKLNEIDFSTKFPLKRTEDIKYALAFENSDYNG